MVAIKHELDTVQQVKEEIEELREYVDRLEEHTHRRKLRLLEQVCSLNYLPCCVIKYLNFISLFMYKPKHQKPTTNYYYSEPDNHTNQPKTTTPPHPNPPTRTRTRTRNIHPTRHTEPLTAKTVTLMMDRCKCSSNWFHFLPQK